jgi:hypothetical protein
MIAQDARILSVVRSVADGFGPCGSEIEHSVENVDCKSDFCRLCHDVSTSESTADELLVSVEGVLDSCLLVVAGLLLSLPSAEFSDGFDSLVSRACCARVVL